MIDSESTEDVLKEVHAYQCKGGYEKFLGERKGALKIAFDLMKTKDMDFGDAVRKSWELVKAQRGIPCDLGKSSLLIEDKDIRSSEVKQEVKND